MKVKEAGKNIYKGIADAIVPPVFWENGVKLPELEPSEIEKKDSLLLADLSNMWLSYKYPEAFNRTVIAEAATPEETTLKSFDKEKIKKEVLLRGKSDALTAHIFNKLMNGNVEIVSLFEDPYAALNTPALLEEMLKDPIYHGVLGINQEENNVKKRTLRTLNPKTGSAENVTAYQFMRAQGFSDQFLEKHGVDTDALKHRNVYIGPAKMLANSDSAKRGTLAASTLNDVSIKKCLIAACKNPLQVGERTFIYVNPTYMGQGGALVRTTGVNLMTPIYTEQGEHGGFNCGLHASPEKVNRMFGRMAALAVNDDNARSPYALQKAVLEGMPLGNPHGLKDQGIEAEEEAAMKAIDERIRATRDDPRYMDMLTKYGIQDISNYSNRPAGRAANGKLDFTNIRAIGLAAKEMELYTNITGQSELLQFDKNNPRQLLNTDAMAKFYTQNQTGQHNLTSAIFALNMFFSQIGRRWKKGGITMEKDDDGNTLLSIKNGEKITVQELAAKYDEKLQGYKGFDVNDLTLAHFHNHAEKLLNGMEQVRRSIMIEHRTPNARQKSFADITYKNVEPKEKIDPLSLVPVNRQGTIKAYQKRLGTNHDVIDELAAIDPKERTQEQQNSLTMARDAYFQLLESGPPHIGRIDFQTKEISTEPMRTAVGIS